MINIRSDHVEAKVLCSGGILWEPCFRLSDDRWVSPFAKAPWADDITAPPGADLAYIRKLGGAFLGLPFGGRAIDQPAGGWDVAAENTPLHGHCATEDWTIADQHANRVTLTLDFPENGPVRSVNQTFECVADSARINVTIQINANDHGAVAVGYHPILRLPDDPGKLEIIARFGLGHTAPFPGSAARTASDAIFAALDAVPQQSNNTLDLSRLPLTQRGEELALLSWVSEPIIARYADHNYEVRLDWNREILPNCLLWYHDRASDVPPWDRGFRGLGLEPCASAFDFASQTSLNPNPLTRIGERTCVPINPDAATEIKFSVTVGEFS
jgi:hypothetical protein